MVFYAIYRPSCKPVEDVVRSVQSVRRERQGVGGAPLTYADTHIRVTSRCLNTGDGIDSA